MARRPITIASTPGSPSNDGLRSALSKTNQNFTELYLNFDGLSGSLSNLATNVTTNASRIDQLSTTVASLGNVGTKASLSGATFTGGVTFAAGLSLPITAGLSLGGGGILLDEQVGGAGRTRLTAAGDRFVVRNSANTLTLLNVDPSALTYKSFTVWHSGNFSPDNASSPSGSTFAGPLVAPALSATGPAPVIGWTRSTQSDTVSDQNRWEIEAGLSSLQLRLVNDPGTRTVPILTLTRSGMTLTGIALAARPTFAGATPWDSANFSPQAYLPIVGGALQGSLSVKPTTGALAAQASNLATLAVRSGTSASDAAYLSLSRGTYGVYLGLDADNALKVGGWSLGSSAYRIWHEGNLNPSAKANAASPTLTGSVLVAGASLSSPNAGLVLQSLQGGSPSLDFTLPGTIAYDWRIALNPVSGNLSFVRGDARASLGLGSTGLLALTGSGSGLSIAQRDDTTREWLIFGSAGALRLHNGAERLTLSGTGDLAVTSLSTQNGIATTGLLSVRAKADASEGDLHFLDETGLTDWVVGETPDGAFSVWSGPYSAQALSIGADLRLRLPGTPIITEVGVDQAGCANILHAGADPSGVTDSAVAVQTALDALAARGSGTLLIPPGTYRIAQGLTFSGTALQIVGTSGMSVLRQDAATLLSIGAGRLTLRGITTLGATLGGTAFDCASGVVLDVRDLFGYPIDDGHWWDAYFRVSDLSGSLFDTVSIANAVSPAQTNQMLVRGAFLTGKPTITRASNTTFRNLSLRAFHYGVDAVAGSERMEAIRFLDCGFSEVRIGLNYANVAGTNGPGLSWIGGSIEAFERCLRVALDVNTSVRGATLVRDCAFNFPGQHLYADALTGGIIADCLLSVANATGGRSMGSGAGIQVNGSMNVSIHQTVATLPPEVIAAVWLSGGSTACNALNNLTRSTNTTTLDGILDQGSSNYLNGNRRL